MSVYTQHAHWWAESRPDMVHMPGQGSEWYHAPGEVMALVLPGSSDVTETGDCVIMNGRYGFFGLADGSPRDATFSRRFLVQFMEILEKVYEPGNAVSNMDQLGAAVRSMSRDLLKRLKGHASTTFAGMVKIHTPGGIRILVINTGDSACYSMNRNNEVTRLTPVNFWLVGRTEHLHYMEWHTPEPGDLYMLISDGWYGQFDSGEQVFRKCAGIFHDSGAGIDNCIAEQKGDFHSDDMSLLMVSPLNDFTENGEILLGGRAGI